MPEQALPQDSAISATYHNADFADSHWVAVDPLPESALAAFVQMVQQTPAWVNAMMSLRNRIVKLLGLKDLGTLGDLEQQKPLAEYRVGERLGIFTIVSIAQNELVLSDVDKHLRVQLAVQRIATSERRAIAITTVVHQHNWLGRVYMLFVGPMHKLIAPATLAKLGQ
ncbi:DUF2867 domain-containing protein [Chitinibacter sp. GC72]|uniref:DUF2867 domain-containing protein n=1 Tax=Chitinibacter sp. GC72 TaxID=1526917 RepID=UPI0012F792D8|nr:DUF2867 domain-containing protein [Chitinibacter sp. GC72]